MKPTAKKITICVSTDTETRAQLDEIRGKISKSLYITLLINREHARLAASPTPAAHVLTDREA